MEITQQEKEILGLYRELKEWGFGELNIKIVDNELSSIKSTRTFKPVYNPEILHIQATEIILDNS
jgi:hypothetical protein